MDRIEYIATTFAKSYVKFVEALMREGVPEKVAREEARIAALGWLAEILEEEKETTLSPCPLCGGVIPP